MTTPAKKTRTSASSSPKAASGSSGAGHAKVLIGLSGGMDSAVAAALLKSEGYEVEALHLQLVNEEALAKASAPYSAGTGESLQKQFWKGSTHPHCLQAGSLEIARKVAAKIGIPLHVEDVSAQFEEKVLDYFVHEAIQSRVAAPCVPCNSQLRMARLLAKADELGFKWIATGHYAQLSQDGATGIARLSRAADAQADQSALLFELNQKALARCLMPLGGLTQTMVRKLCEEFGLPAAERPAQNGFCLSSPAEAKFVLQLVEANTPPNLRVRGIMKTSEGKIVGSHAGLYRFRVGDPVVGVDFSNESGQQGLYVTGFDLTSQSLIVGTEKKLLSTEALAAKARWVKPVDGLRPLRCQGQVVVGEGKGASLAPSPCVVTQFENEMIHVRFEQPQRALAPGQPLIFLEGEEIIGGAFIEKVEGAGFGSGQAKRP